eukprot:SAG31_NODE_1271_length_9064_cov_10.148912_3_plen_78_part_00
MELTNLVGYQGKVVTSTARIEELIHTKEQLSDQCAKLEGENLDLAVSKHLHLSFASHSSQTTMFLYLNSGGNGEAIG